MVSSYEVEGEESREPSQLAESCRIIAGSHEFNMDPRNTYSYNQGTLPSGLHLYHHGGISRILHLSHLCGVFKLNKSSLFKMVEA